MKNLQVVIPYDKYGDYLHSVITALIIIFVVAGIIFAPTLIEGVNEVNRVDESLNSWSPDFVYEDVSEFEPHDKVSYEIASGQEHCEEHFRKTLEVTGKIAVINRDMSYTEQFPDEGGSIYLYSTVNEQQKIVCDFYKNDISEPTVTIGELKSEYEDGDLVTVIGEIDSCAYELSLCNCRIKHAEQ